MIEHDDVDEFVLQVGTRNGDFYPVTVLRSPAGTGGTTRLAARDYRRAVPATTGGARDISVDPDDEAPLLALEEVGRELFRALITGDVSALFERSLGITSARGRRLRIRLHLNVADPTIAPVAALPWETMFRQETRSYLTLSPDTTFVRSLDVPISLYEVRDDGDTVKVLFVMSNPKGDLNLGNERAAIERLLGEEKSTHKPGAAPALQAEFLENATFSALEALLYRNDYQIVHFMGHGAVSATGEGQLLFHDGLRSGRDLGELLKSERTTRLVTLNACNTAGTTERDDADPFAGVATALVMAGVPAVIAMQFRVSDIAAIAFAARLYSDIGRGRSIEASVDSGRRRVKAMNPDQHEWATPVLYLRDPSLVRSSAGMPSARRASGPTGDVIVPRVSARDEGPTPASFSPAPPSVKPASTPPPTPRAVPVISVAGRPVAAKSGSTMKKVAIGVFGVLVILAGIGELVAGDFDESSSTTTGALTEQGPSGGSAFAQITYAGTNVVVDIESMQFGQTAVLADGTTGVNAQPHESVSYALLMRVYRSAEGCARTECDVTFRIALQPVAGTSSSPDDYYSSACEAERFDTGAASSTHEMRGGLIVPEEPGTYLVGLQTVVPGACNNENAIWPRDVRPLFTLHVVGTP